MTVGFIGTGSMGLPLAANILDQEQSLVAFDINADATQPLAEKQARIVRSPVEVANEAEVVFACMPSIESFNAVVTGQDGIIHGSRMKTFVNLGTMGTEALAEIEKVLGEKGIPMLDSPITGGVQRAWDKDITVIASGPQALYDEMKAFREACGDAHVKAILATGELGTLRNVARASLICMMAGADFIKTSTGKESVNATLPVSLTMIRAIRAYHAMTGWRVGYKPAGGISKAKDALVYLSLIKEELGERWLQPDLFRFGASSLLGDIERQLEHHVTGAYSAGYRHAMG